MGFDPSALMSIPAKSLSHITFYTPALKWARMFPFLEQCGSLVSLELTGSPASGDDSTVDRAPLVMPNLEVLSTDSPLFGRILVTPRLRELQCRYDACAVRKTAPLPVLDCLELIMPRLRLSDVPNWQPTPSLWNISTLKLKKCNYVDDLLNILLDRYPRDGTTVLAFPSLRKLNLQWCSTYQKSPAALGALVLKVLDIRPALKLECDSHFETTPKDQLVRYGTRIHGRPAW